MKIAFFVSEFPSLSQTFILGQVTGLLELGHEVDIYARRRGAMEVVHEVVTRYRLLERTRFPGKHELASLLQQTQHDILHCQFGTLAPRLLPLRDRGLAGAKLITSFRGFDATHVPTNWPGLYDELFDRGDSFLPVCRRLGERLVELGCDASRIVVHHSGIDLARFPFSERQLPRGAPVQIVSVGRLVEKKGFGYAIRAVARVLAAGREVTYTIVGGGALREELESLVESLGVQSQVRLVGSARCEDVVEILKNSHIMLAPSVTTADGDQEGIPNALKEAMASGLPVITTLHGGIPELVEDRISGELVPEHDVGALTERLIRLCDHPETWPKLGKAARKQVEDQFDIAKLNDELVAHYQGLLQR